MKRKKASISFVLLVSLVVLCAGAAVLSVGISSKYNAKAEYQRVENRYVAESGIDLAVGLFLNYLSNQDYTIQYTKNEDGSYSIVDDYAPYLLDEIRLSASADSIPIRLVETESSDYLSSIGFLDFKRENGIGVNLNMFSLRDNFKLSRLCFDPDFVVSRNYENNTIPFVKSRINPLYLTVQAKYKGGEVMCNVQISDLYVVRKPFYEVENGEMGSVSAGIDKVRAKVSYENYQNYRRKGQ